MRCRRLGVVGHREGASATTCFLIRSVASNTSKTTLLSHLCESTVIAFLSFNNEKTPSAEQLKKRFPVVMRNRKLGVVVHKESESALRVF